MIRLLTLAVIVFNVSGNYFLSRGMQAGADLVSLSPLDYIRALGQSWVPLGVALLIAWLISQLSLLSWADLSYVLPFTAISYVFAALLGAVLLNEHVSASRWAGVLLIFAGVAMVGRTAPRTTPPPVGGRG